MTSKAAAATDAAHRIFVRAAGDAGAAEDAAAAERLCIQLRTGLRRWIGNEGYRALLDRALESVRTEHPALDNISCLREDAPAITTAVRARSAAEITAGMVALMAAVIELLGRIVGEEMAVHLVEQIGAPSPRGRVNAEPEGGRDG